MKIHFIGICGVAMSALAIAFKKEGWRVTGSDAGFFPPISTYLRKNKIDFYPGWHPEKIGRPDLIVVGNVASSTNPEWRYAREQKLNYRSYPEVVKEFIIKKNSIVVAGTFSKSTNAALMSWILKETGFNPSYMFGGVSLNDMPAAEITDSAYSVVEGDEYKTSRWDARAKFIHYSPTYLLLTAAVWDHADIYPTRESYEKAFRDLIELVPRAGIIVANSDEETVRQLLAGKTKKIITFGASPEADYQYKNVKLTKNGTSFEIVDKATNQTISVRAKMLGEYIAKNFTGCFALSRALGIAPTTIVRTIESFRGVKRRLEKRFENGITVYDDISHSPEKSRAVLSSLTKICAGDIYAVYEPNTGNRKPASFSGYDHCFAAADTVIIPKLTKVKIDPNDPAKPVNGAKLAEIIKKTHENVLYIDEDNELVGYLAKNAKENDCIVFLGSHGFRGMIEQLVTFLRQ